MVRDPLYRQIVSALDGELDEDLFERCAVDLLRTSYPGIVPMVGGDDAGFDGAVGTAHGPYPLLSTIDKRGPLRNLRKNLRTYVQKRKGPKFALIATPRALSNRQKRTLEDTALQEFGIQIVNVHDQAFFADALYRDADWRRQLLGIGGRPGTLSALPRRSRPERPVLTARTTDLKWLREADGDLLVVGQPGIGKTYLHEALVEEGEALFAIDPDAERLADGLRMSSPRVVIVDDAQDALTLIETLRRLRVEAGFQFRIHANCWSHHEATVRTALDIPPSNVRRLELLTREELLEVIQSLGLVGPDPLLHVLLNQAEGKPGLATALVAAAKRGDIERVWTGEALAELLLHSRQTLPDRRDVLVLAAFALGGDAGAGPGEVADFLGLTSVEVSTTVTNLAAGGMIEEVRRADRLCIRPPALRGILIREAFFVGAGRIEPSEFVDRLRTDPFRIRYVAASLLSARQCGADIADDVLLEVASDADDEGVWQHAGYVGGTLSRSLVRQHPEAIVLAADGLLRHVPDEVLPFLLAAGSDAMHGRQRQAVQSVEEWIQGDHPGDPTSLHRRRRLLAALKSHGGASSREVSSAHSWALALVVGPEVDTHNVPPGSGMVVNVYRGLRSLDQLKAIASLWPEVLRLCGRLPFVPADIRNVVEDWCYPGRHAPAGVSKDVVEFMKSTAARMLTDLARSANCNRPCKSWLAQVASRAGLGIDVRVDKTFRRIFESRDFTHDVATHQRRREKVLGRLAAGFLKLGPEKAVRELAAFEREAATFGWSDGYDRGFLYYRLAQTVSDPLPWLTSALTAHLPPAYTSPFLAAATRPRSEAGDEVLVRIFGSDDYREYVPLAVEAVLSMGEPSEGLLRSALARLEVNGHNTTFLLRHCAPSVSVMRQLLRHPNPNVRVHAAFAEWLLDPEGTIRSVLTADWRAAIVAARNEYEFVLAKILDSDELLAVDWVLAKIADEVSEKSGHRFNLWRLNGLIGQVAAHLAAEHRWALLDRLPESATWDETLRSLIRDDADLARRWIHKHFAAGNRPLALRILNRELDDLWEQFAIVALNQGATESEIADWAITEGGKVITGPWSAHYDGLIPRYERLSAHPDERLRPAGSRGLDWARHSMAREVERERAKAVRGR